MDEKQQVVICDELQLVACISHSISPPYSSLISELVAKEIVVMMGRFPDLTYEETLLAIRFNADAGLAVPKNTDIEKIKFSGNFIGINFLSQIFKNYMSLRNLLDQKLKNFIDGLS